MWNVIHEFVCVIRGVPADGWIAVFTGLTTLIFLGQLLAMRAANRHFRRVERAYLKISHVAPGLKFYKGSSGLMVEVKNHGTTPGRLTDAVLTARILPINSLPPVPPYATAPHAARHAFLVTSDRIVFEERFSVTLAETQARQSETRVFIFGYADYIDVFGKRYRAGYGRFYIDAADGVNNNLGFIEQPGYNYDRPRVRGEGNDWKET